VAVDRRELLKWFGCAVTSCAALADAEGGDSSTVLEDAYGVLVDTTTCIGCRKCEWACNQASGLPLDPLERFEDKSVFARLRRPDAGHYTVVNRFAAKDGTVGPLYVKVQCMHCNDPSCYSACVVTAFQKQPNGAVTYDPWRCMGCRYCMVSCPFQVPAYEYSNALTPQVRKCTFCYQRVSQEGKAPACVEICPPQCLSFGRRSDLLTVARQRIEGGRGRYVDHIYGEHEVGGTSWLYLSSVPFTEIGFPKLPSEAPARLTERTQHGVFKLFIPPVALFTMLAGVMRLFRPEREESGREGRESS
jgi:formate dehydrogenase iron-sulfur subunit